MLLEGYYLQDESGIHFSREQASRFAKGVAGDFNPLHDVNAKRFCVPGDLLFAVTLAQRGLWQKMAFTFAGMVTDALQLSLESPQPGTCLLADDHGKEYLKVECEGDNTTDEKLIRDLVYNYVEFSGKTFPHILIPLLEKQQVMINPARPMVIYESMEISLDRLDVDEITLKFDDARLEVNGKRGTVHLLFNLFSGDEKIGQGDKKMLLSGLQPYDAEKVNALVADFNKIKDAYDPDNPAL
jgi:hypothetical protein